MSRIYTYTQEYMYKILEIFLLYNDPNLSIKFAKARSYLHKRLQ